MATEVHAGGYGEVRAASTASGGTALTSTAARIVLPKGTNHITMLPRNYASSAVVVKFNLNPWLLIFKSTDALADMANLTDYSDNAQDNSTSTDVTLSSLGTLAQGDALYVGSWTPFGGLVVDVDAANGNASVLTVHYSKNDNTWADISASDGTDSGGASMAVDGNITWTVPTDWGKIDLKTLTTTAAKNQGLFTEPEFWVRLSFSAALDSSTTLNSVIAINRDTTYAELPAGTGWEQHITVGRGGHYSITALTDTGTANLIVNCATNPGGRF